MSTDSAGAKHVTLYYDDTQGKVADLQALREKYATQMPVFTIKYRPREEC